VTEREDPVPASAPGGARPIPERRSFKEVFLSRRFGPTAVIALAALIGLAVWLVIDSRDNSGTRGNSNIGPTAFSLAGLKSFAGTVSQPIYWVGARRDRMYEITKNSSGVYLRYLPTGVKAGDPKPLLTIGTYPLENAYAVTKTGSTGPNAVTLDITGGGIATYNKKHKANVYVAYPGSAFQIEVFAPNPSIARRLATSGRIEPLLKTAESQARGPVAVSRPELRALPASLGHSVYWAGARANMTYELWQTPRGYTFIRYLPAGVAVGSEGGRHLIIATYPMKNAFKITQSSAAKGRGTVRISVPGGGIAAYAKQHATNVYLAYPGQNVQIEVYDPSPNAALQLVKSGRISPVG
jgi:hypothetical protein